MNIGEEVAVISTEDEKLVYQCNNKYCTVFLTFIFPVIGAGDLSEKKLVTSIFSPETIQ